MLEFESKKIDLDLKIKVEGKEKIFKFQGDGKVNAKRGSALGNEFKEFEKANESLPESERRDPGRVLIYELKMIYPTMTDEDTDWLWENFTIGQLSDMVRQVSIGMLQAKN